MGYKFTVSGENKMSNSYYRYKEQRATRGRVKQPASDKKNINNFFKYLKVFVLSGTALMLAGIVALNLYLSSLPPINHLESFKPNIVTIFVQFRSHNA